MNTGTLLFVTLYIIQRKINNFFFVTQIIKSDSFHRLQMDYLSYKCFQINCHVYTLAYKKLPLKRPKYNIIPPFEPTKRPFCSNGR